MSISMAWAASVNPRLLEIMESNDRGNYYTGRRVIPEFDKVRLPVKLLEYLARKDEAIVMETEISDNKNVLPGSLDLELAAAIGKNLLERNKELELLLHSTQEYAEEQVKKSEYLSRQLDDAREMNESRVKLLEQIESHSDELSRSHSKLKMEAKSIQEHNEILAENLQAMVEQCDHYKTEMEDLKMANARLQRQLSTTQATESSDEPQTTKRQPKDYEKELVEKEVKKLSVAIEELISEQDREKSTRKELENELSQLIIQNRELEHKLRLFARGSTDSYEEENEKDHSVTEEEEEEEENYMDESFVVVESQDIEEIASDLSQSLEHCDISFLDELGQQYQDLVNKYNALMEKCKSEGIPYESREMCMVQREVQTSHTGMDVVESEKTEGCGEESMPEYKKMFAMIYEKLREGRNES